MFEKIFILNSLFLLLFVVVFHYCYQVLILLSLTVLPLLFFYSLLLSFCSFLL